MTGNDWEHYAPTSGDIGEPVRHIELEPIPQQIPVPEPVKAPERELEPSK